MDTALVKRARVFVDSRTGRARGSGRSRAADSRRRDRRHAHRRRARRAGSGTVAGAQRPTMSRSSSRWGWRSKTSRPRTSPTSARRSAASAAAFPGRSQRATTAGSCSSSSLRASASSSSRRSACVLRRTCWPRRAAAAASAELAATAARDAATRRHADPAAQLRGLLVEHRQPLARFRDFALQPAECPSNPLRRLEQDAVGLLPAPPSRHVSVSFPLVSHPVSGD